MSGRPPKVTVNVDELVQRVKPYPTTWARNTFCTIWSISDQQKKSVGFCDWRTNKKECKTQKTKSLANLGVKVLAGTSYAFGDVLLPLTENAIAMKESKDYIFRTEYLGRGSVWGSQPFHRCEFTRVHVFHSGTLCQYHTTRCAGSGHGILFPYIYRVHGH